MRCVGGVREMTGPLGSATGARLDISLVHDATRRRLVVAGEMDLATSPSLEGAVIRVCREGAEQLVLDLSQLEFIDGSGLHAVSSARETCRQFGCEFWIVPGRKELHRLFKISGLDERLPFRPPDRESGEPDPSRGVGEGASW
jgi:anti-sigma B factor antagonist